MSHRFSVWSRRRRAGRSLWLSLGTLSLGNKGCLSKGSSWVVSVPQEGPSGRQRTREDTFARHVHPQQTSRGCVSSRVDPTDGHRRRWRAASERDGKRLRLGMWADAAAKVALAASTRHVCYGYLGGNASGYQRSVRSAKIWETI